MLMMRNKTMLRIIQQAFSLLSIYLVFRFAKSSPLFFPILIAVIWLQMAIAFGFDPHIRHPLIKKHLF